AASASMSPSSGGFFFLSYVFVHIDSISCLLRLFIYNISHRRQFIPAPAFLNYIQALTVLLCPVHIQLLKRSGGTDILCLFCKRIFLCSPYRKYLIEFQSFRQIKCRHSQATLKCGTVAVHIRCIHTAFYQKPVDVIGLLLCHRDNSTSLISVCSKIHV